MSHPLVVMAIVLTCILTGAAVGMRLHDLLPKDDLVGASADVIKLAMGLLATVLALVLSLLISSANSTRNTVETEYRQSLSDVGMLDRNLANYGVETGEARRFMRDALVRRFAAVWPSENFGAVPPAAAGELPVEGLQRRLLQLSPGTDVQKWFLQQSLATRTSLAQLHWLLLGQEAGTTLPVPLLLVVTFWSTTLFVGFGLFCRPNRTVVAALFIAALTVSSAVFLIADLNRPFTGLVQISSRPAHALLELLGK